jgi:next-to-BRCA1 protein 1
MREQQRTRREQMIAQMNAQREQQQQQASSDYANATYPHRPSGQRSTESDAEKQRREALKQRVAHIKANILKTREEREQAERAEKKAKDNEKVQNILAQLAKTEESAPVVEEQKEEKLSDSQMVFPKLDKESPTSSTYESATSSTLKTKAKAAYVENEDGEVERTAAPAPDSLASPSVEADDGFVDLDEELEVFSADGDSDEEGDGFMTDEEYDILDASDTETVASGWRG